MKTINRSTTGMGRSIHVDRPLIVSMLVVVVLIVTAMAVLRLASVVPTAAGADAAAVLRPIPYEPAQEAELARLRYAALQAARSQAAGDYAPATEAELARLRYAALQVQLAARPGGGYDAATEMELARVRFEALQAQWRVQAAAMDYGAGQELTLAQQRYAALQAQRPDLYGRAP